MGDLKPPFARTAEANGGLRSPIGAPGGGGGEPHHEVTTRRHIALDQQCTQSFVEAFRLETLRPEPDIEGAKSRHAAQSSPPLPDTCRSSDAVQEDSRSSPQLSEIL